MVPLPTRTISIGDASVTVEVADTPPSIAQGLSGRAFLQDGCGMIFIFNMDSRWRFWMKDMRFPVDIIWADALGTILMIAHRVSPASFPNRFYPPQPARYVLEVPSGFAAEHHITEGMKIEIR
jgi:uncharacterized membrane protein (UPF0127 family)